MSYSAPCHNTSSAGQVQSGAGLHYLAHVDEARPAFVMHTFQHLPTTLSCSPGYEDQQSLILLLSATSASLYCPVYLPHSLPGGDLRGAMASASPGHTRVMASRNLSQQHKPSLWHWWPAILTSSVQVHHMQGGAAPLAHVHR